MRIFVLTGAGVSAESGLGTFRDKGGLWSRFDLQEVATPEGFARDPAKVHDFYSMRRTHHREARPNPAHQALARLEAGLEARGDHLFLCTQNVDNLHEKAGSRRVHHMHGEVFVTRCLACERRFEDADPLSLERTCPECATTGKLRPDVVWFGETPIGLDRCFEELAAADLFVAMGTSGSVWPAAGFVREAKAAGAATLEINLEPTAGVFDLRRLGTASEVVPAWVDEVLG